MRSLSLTACMCRRKKRRKDAPSRSPDQSTSDITDHEEGELSEGDEDFEERSVRKFIPPASYASAPALPSSSLVRESTEPFVRVSDAVWPSSDSETEDTGRELNCDQPGDSSSSSKSKDTGRELNCDQPGDSASAVGSSDSK